MIAQDDPRQSSCALQRRHVQGHQIREQIELEERKHSNCSADADREATDLNQNHFAYNRERTISRCQEEHASLAVRVNGYLRAYACHSTDSWCARDWMDGIDWRPGQFDA